MEEGNSKFRHNILDIRTCSHNTGSLLEEGNDPRHFPSLCSRREGDDGFSTLRMGCSPDEIHLAPKAAVNVGADRVRTDLTCDVHFDRRVNGNHIIVS